MDNEQINVSVIIPVYNAENYIEQCLVSLLNQTYKRFELILVNDGSTDHSGQICEEYACKFQYINIIHKKNEGSNAARIDGLHMACGQYVSFIDADDWVDKDFLELLVTHMESCHADIVVTGCIKEGQGLSEKEINHFCSGIYEREKLIRDVFPRMLHFQGFYEFGILPYLCNKMFLREKLLACYNGIDTGIYDGEDVAVVYPYLLYTYKAVICNSAKYHYRIHSVSITANKKQDYYSNVAKLYLHLYCKFLESEYSDCLLKQLDQYMRMMVWNGNPKGFIGADESVFPFDQVPRGAFIVLYAAGNVGRRYYAQICKTGYCHLTAWVDQDWNMEEMQQLGVESPDVIEKRAFDYIVIAIENLENVRQVRSYLLKKGIENSKIISKVMGM